MFRSEDKFICMSDEQKGLYLAFEKVLPTVQNRFCVRHLHFNLKRSGFRDDAFKKIDLGCNKG